jgi:mannosyl-3-phosphoglycerate phosphatase
MRKTEKVVIFSDLDGTLLDHHTYSFDQALPALEAIRKGGIPLILCSSKTRAEIELYQKKLSIKDPFICENGGAVFIRRGYFRLLPDKPKRKGNNLVLELGTPYAQIRKKFLEVLRKLKLKAVGFGDLKAQEISSLLGLSQTEAELAKKREYDEPFYFEEKKGRGKIKSAEKEFKKVGLNLTRGGRLLHVTGDNDKGKAVRLLSQTYRHNWGGDVLTVGLGDGLNDLPLLRSVDIPILLRRKNSSYEPRIVEELKVRKAPGMGPAAWNKAVLGLIRERTTKRG